MEELLNSRSLISYLYTEQISGREISLNSIGNGVELHVRSPLTVIVKLFCFSSWPMDRDDCPFMLMLFLLILKVEFGYLKWQCC